MTAIVLSFYRDEELSPEKLSAFERALENSYSLYREGLKMHSEMLGDVPNKHIKMSLAVARGSACALLEMIEKQGDIVVLDKEHAAAMLMPFTLAASELLNTEPFK
jgi:hypothetical protein